MVEEMYWRQVIGWDSFSDYVSRRPCDERRMTVPSTGSRSNQIPAGTSRAIVGQPLQA